ncbi:hypothetical protein Tco_0731634 [Tanacetum coccineum]
MATYYQHQQWLTETIVNNKAEAKKLAEPMAVTLSIIKQREDGSFKNVYHYHRELNILTIKESLSIGPRIDDIFDEQASQVQAFTSKIDLRSVNIN